MHNKKRNSAGGFTLIEISIVLVIIGLIVGGVLVGRDLIKAAELRSVISDAEKYKTAVNAFRLKYNAIPGDMANATTLWGAADNNFNTCKTTIGSGTETCNGNGDWKIGYPPFGYPLPLPYENFRFWQHLANANLIGGKYTGVGPVNNSEANIGINVPAARISGTGFSIENSLGYGTVNYSGEYWPATDSAFSILEFGGSRTGDVLNYPALRPSEAYSIDQKIDDGLPAAGQVLTFMSSYNPSCTTSDVAAVSRYNLTYISIACSLVFKSGVGY